MARAEDDDKKRRRGGLRPLASTLPKITKRALGKRGFAEGGLVGEWASIVGAEVAARCLPKKLSPARPGGHNEGTLTLRVEAGFATELQHLTPIIIERINGYFGYRAIGHLKFQQSLPGPRQMAKPPAPALSAEEEAALQRRTQAIEDPDLRGALERLGRAVQQQGDS